MKRYAFFYHDTLEADYTPECYKDKLTVVEHSFPKGMTDWEILDSARQEEEPRTLHDSQYASEHYFTRKLIRVVEIARDLSLPPAE